MGSCALHIPRARQRVRPPPADRRAFLARANKLETLRSIELSGQWFDRPEAARWLVDSPLGARLERISLSGTCASLADWLRLVERARKASFRFFHPRAHGGALDISRDRRGKLSIAHARIGGYRDAPQVESDRLSFAELSTLLASLPPDALSTLHITGRSPTAGELKRLLSACTHLPRALGPLETGAEPEREAPSGRPLARRQTATGSW